MNEKTVNLIIQLSSLALQTLVEYARRPPVDDDERRARDRAVIALMEQSRLMGEAVLAAEAAAAKRAAARPGVEWQAPASARWDGDDGPDDAA